MATVPVTGTGLEADPDLEEHDDDLDEADEATVKELLGLDSDEDDDVHVPWGVEDEQKDEEEDPEVVVGGIRPACGGFSPPFCAPAIPTCMTIEVNTSFRNPLTQMRSSTTPFSRGCPPKWTSPGSPKPSTHFGCLGPPPTHRPDTFRTLT